MPKYSGNKRKLCQVTDTFHYIPLFESLKVLVKDPTILHEIDHCHERIHVDDTSVIVNCSNIIKINIFK